MMSGRIGARNTAGSLTEFSDASPLSLYIDTNGLAQACKSEYFQLAYLQSKQKCYKNLAIFWYNEESIVWCCLQMIT